MAMITTTSHHPWPLDVLIEHLEEAGLPTPSIVRMKLFTLDHRFVLKKLGFLHVSDQRRLKNSLKRLFSL